MASQSVDSFKFRPSSLVLLWAALVAIGVCGRLWQPAANVTPLAAIALVSGSLFAGSVGGSLIAAATPLAAVLLSNLVLPPYGSPIMALVVFTALAWPSLLGGVIRRQGWLAIFGGSLAASLVFFLSTNFAHWVLSNQYPHTLTGLGACYIAALPFYRWMPLGDLAWTTALFAGLAAVSFLERAAVAEPLVSATCSSEMNGRLTDDQSGRQ